jgi:hypothetical protein
MQSDASSTTKSSCTLFALCVQNYEIQVLSSTTVWRFSVASLYFFKLQGWNLLSCWSAKWCIFHYHKTLHTVFSVRAKSRNASFFECDITSFFRFVSLLVQATRLIIAVKLECKLMYLLLPKGVAHCLLRECKITKCKFCRSWHFFLFPLRLSTCATYNADVCFQVRVQWDAFSTT